MQAIMNTKFKLFKNQKGLTLVELLAVIVILGVIAAIAVPAIGGVITNSKKNSDIQSEALIKDAAVRYLTDVAPKGYVTGIPGLTSATELSIANGLVAEDYLKEVPKKQTANNTAYTKVTVAYDTTKGTWSASAVSTD